MACSWSLLGGIKRHYLLESLAQSKSPVIHSVNIEMRVSARADRITRTAAGLGCVSTPPCIRSLSSHALFPKHHHDPSYLCHGWNAFLYASPSSQLSYPCFKAQPHGHALKKPPGPRRTQLFLPSAPAALSESAPTIGRKWGSYLAFPQ